MTGSWKGCSTVGSRPNDPLPMGHAPSSPRSRWLGNRDSVHWLSDYAAVLFAALGDRVPRWLTINEAKIIAQQGYLYGRMAPGKSSVLASGRVIHHLNLAHGEAVAAFRASPAIGQIGPCLQLAPCYPADGSPEAAAAATAADTLENALYLEPVLRSHYPALAMRIAGLSTALTPQSWMAT